MPPGRRYADIPDGPEAMAQARQRIDAYGKATGHALLVLGLFLHMYMNRRPVLRMGVDFIPFPAPDAAA